MAFRPYSFHFEEHANDRNVRGDVGELNPNPLAIFFNDVVRKTVIKNLVDLSINADTAVAILGVRGHEVEPLVRSDLDGKSGRWEHPAVLTRWIDTQLIIGSFSHSPHWYSQCIQAMALRGDEAIPEDEVARQKHERHLGLRMVYEVNLALAKLLRMKEFLTEANAVAETWTGLLWPVHSPTEWRFVHLVHNAFAAQLGLPDYDAPRQFYQEFLYDLTLPVEQRTTQAKELSAHCFRTEMSRRFRPWIPGPWPDGTDARIRKLLLAHRNRFGEQEAAEIRNLCHVFGNTKGQTKKQMDENIAIMRAVGQDWKVRRQALKNIQAWLAKTHPRLAVLVRPIGRRY